MQINRTYASHQTETLLLINNANETFNILRKIKKKAV